MKKSYQRTLHNLPENTVEAWLFESFAERFKTAQSLNTDGNKVKLHSAYKTLLCRVLEEDLLADAKVATIRYPVIDGDEPLRFKIECYPLADLVCTTLTFEPFDFSLADGLPYYEIISDKATTQIPIPVRWFSKPTGEQHLAACGWVKTSDGKEMHLLTEFEAIYQDAINHVNAIDINGKTPPFFDRLIFEIGLPTKDIRLSIGNEHISLSEAMHEDIYFSALEVFQHRLNLEPGDRNVAPGQIIPMISYSEKPYLTTTQQIACSVDMNNIGGCPNLRGVGHWLTPKQIKSHLELLGGERFIVRSRQLRNVEGRFIGNPSAKVKLAISAGQHANESSGIVGALRAGYALKDNTQVAFTICPSENVDGYATFRQLCQDNPSHMHHAARYTAAGNDLSHGKEFESRIRHEAKSRLAADVHINLHGYPAHEWTRPLSGYVPKGFASWTIPKGFLLICRYHPGYHGKATQILRAAIEAIAEYDEQMAQNRNMLSRYLSAVGNLYFEVSHGVIPYIIEEREDMIYPIEILTEAPDETVYGESFRIAHESQYRVILAVANKICIS